RQNFQQIYGVDVGEETAMSTLTIIVVLIAAIIVYHFLPEKVRAPERANPKPRHVFASESDTNWRANFHANTESPAEVAFINAMIDGFDLRPKHGALFSDALRLDLQVEQGHYRADFMINHWLVVEIDGAAWHSSDEAKANDARRDVYFESLGYTTLRIPAKTALYQPHNATSSVRMALAKGKRPVLETVAPAPRSGFLRLAETGSLMAKALSEVAEHSSQSVAVQRALEPARLAFHFEKLMIEKAIEAVERDRRTEAYLDTEEKRASFDAFSARLQQRLAELDASDNRKREKLPTHVFPTNVPSSDLHAEAIGRKFAQMRSERACFLSSIANRLGEDAGLKKGVIDVLRRFECAHLIPLVVPEAAS
ncbi:endonuclease domain-containing protein, partial [Sphingomonas lacusdianchii]|uniref:endonuclease domain-containing protein n=1 Tax=Sphingomonas lacusdianchii TaxID=2917992 RepID=UPI001F5631E8